MEKSKEQWHDLSKNEYDSLLSSMRAEGAFEASVGSLSPVGFLIIVIVAFVPPLFIGWSILLFLIVRTSKKDRLLLTDKSIVLAARRLTSYKVLSVDLSELTNVQVRTNGTDITEIFDRLFGFGTVAAYRKGSLLPVLAASDVHKPGLFVAEWKRRAPSPAT